MPSPEDKYKRMSDNELLVEIVNLLQVLAHSMFTGNNIKVAAVSNLSNDLKEELERRNA